MRYFVTIESEWCDWIVADSKEEAENIATNEFFNVIPKIWIEEEEED